MSDSGEPTPASFLTSVAVAGDATAAPADTLGIDPRDLRSLTTEAWVAEVATGALRTMGAESSETKRTADEILERIRATPFENHVSENTFRAYLSRAARDLGSPIASAGRGRGGGYYVSSIPAAVADATEDEAQDGTAVVPPRGLRVEKERLLYPVLKSWLIERGYRADDTSSGRKLGRWGNPDVVGLQIHEHLGAVDLQIASIEAKTSADDWERWIFEAVSHRRFANRAYFAFAIPDEFRGKVSEDLRYYSERFGIGVLTVVLDNDQYQRLHAGDLEEPVTAEDADIVELYAASPSPVPMRYRRQLCDALGITGLEGLFAWGQGA